MIQMAPAAITNTTRNTAFKRGSRLRLLAEGINATTPAGKLQMEIREEIADLTENG